MSNTVTGHHKSYTYEQGVGIAHKSSHQITNFSSNACIEIIHGHTDIKLCFFITQSKAILEELGMTLISASLPCYISVDAPLTTDEVLIWKLLFIYPEVRWLFSLGVNSQISVRDIDFSVWWSELPYWPNERAPVTEAIIFFRHLLGQRLFHQTSTENLSENQGKGWLSFLQITIIVHTCCTVDLSELAVFWDSLCLHTTAIAKLNNSLPKNIP